MWNPILAPLKEMKIILASNSKERANILRKVLDNFDVFPSNFIEDLNQKEYTFSGFVENTAKGKVVDVLAQLKEKGNVPDVIIGVDTMIAHNGKLFGKPKSKEDALITITRLTQSNIPHSVYTGVCIWYKEKFELFTEVTTVYMKQLTDEELKAYVETLEPLGKAGSYAIQGMASSFVERIEGDYYNIVGLPICKLFEKLKQILLKK